MEWHNASVRLFWIGSDAPQTITVSSSKSQIGAGTTHQTVEPTTHTDQFRWFAISTKPHQERIAETTLRSLGIETFCPLLQERKWIRRRQVTKVSPLFPGYLFARFSLEESYRAVMYARGVKSIVRFGPHPAVVDDSLIQGLKDRLDGGYLTIPTPSFRPGQIVRITNGALSGLEAVFERQLTGSQRAILLLKTLAFRARVVVDLEQIVNL